jgi:RND family efflux transporter MFP subunit
MGFDDKKGLIFFYLLGFEPQRERHSMNGSVGHGSAMERLFLGLIVVLLGLSCHEGTKPKKAPASSPVQAPLVEAVAVRTGSLPLVQRLNGRVRAENQISIHPELSARVLEVLVQDGDRVAVGDLLVRLHDGGVLEQLKQAESGLAIAKAQRDQAQARLLEAQSAFHRAEALSKEKILSDSDLEVAMTRLVSARADLQLAEARVQQAGALLAEEEESLTKTEIRSPIAGLVGNRSVEIGLLVQPSDRLFTLGRMDRVVVEVVLTDKMLSFAKVGMRCEVMAPGDRLLEGHLTRLSPFLNPVSHATTAELDLDNEHGWLLPGMFLPVDLFYGESQESALVPLSALARHPLSGVEGVYVLSDMSEHANEPGLEGDREGEWIGQATFTNVTILARGRHFAGVEGVKAGSFVLTLGHHLLQGDGGAVRVRRVSEEKVVFLQNLQREDMMEAIVRSTRQANLLTDPPPKGEAQP